MNKSTVDLHDKGQTACGQPPSSQQLDLFGADAAADRPELPPLAVKATRWIDRFFEKHPLVLSPPMAVWELHAVWGDWCKHAERLAAFAKHRARVLHMVTDHWQGQRSIEANQARARAKSNAEIAEFAADYFQAHMEQGYRGAFENYTEEQQKRVTKSRKNGDFGIAGEDFERLSAAFLDDVTQRPGIEHTWPLTLAEVERHIFGGEPPDDIREKRHDSVLEETFPSRQSCDTFVDRDQVEVLSFQDKYLSAEIQLAWLPNGRWVVATEHAYHTGNYAGHGSPLSGKYDTYATREEALEIGKLALERRVADGIRSGDSLVNPNQREAFARFLRWLSPAQKELGLER